MNLYLVKTPNLIKTIFKDLVWSFSNLDKKLYLTFDDGPTPEITNFILAELKKMNAKATFFCVGENVKKYPAIFQQIIDDGHSVGNHTFNHLNGWKTSTAVYLKNIEVSEKYFEGNSKLFRPPYGKITLSQVKKLRTKGYQIIMWDVLSGDFNKSISPEKVMNNVLNNTQNGSIIVFHDHQKAHKNLAYCLPKILDYYSNLGFTFEKIT
ncbi:MAG: polysaccharide deacetylase family protein [Flavobacteriaceae bacterium]|nr:polysaccharide deacetylase family protein [Flavobacteriaceae bacterium]